MTEAISSNSSALLQSYIDKTYGTTSTTATVSSSSEATSLSSVTGDFNTFLKILTAQLANQDPTSAMDTNQFTQELVQFSGVEQQINTNSKLDKIYSALNSNGITPLLIYVGKTVEADADGKISLQSNLGAFSYTLPSEANVVKIAISDSSGKIIANMTGSMTKGVNRVAWDGTCDDGTTASSGTYNVKVTATDSNGKAITSTDLHMIGVVSGIKTEDSTTTLSVGSLDLDASKITAVYSGVSTSSSSTSTDTTTTS